MRTERGARFPRLRGVFAAFAAEVEGAASIRTGPFCRTIVWSLRLAWLGGDNPDDAGCSPPADLCIRLMLQT